MRSNNHEVIFYDKLQDLQNSKLSSKRCIEDDNKIQIDLLDRLRENKPFEILRMEVRYGNRRKLRSDLKKCGIQLESLTFSEMFSTSISKKLLLMKLQKIIDLRPNLLNTKNKTTSELIADIQLNHPGISYSQLFKLVGAYLTINEVGVRGLRELTKSYNKTQWYRLNKQMNDLTLSQSNSFLDKIMEDLREFKAISLAHYVK